MNRSEEPTLSVELLEELFDDKNERVQAQIDEIFVEAKTFEIAKKLRRNRKDKVLPSWLWELCEALGKDRQTVSRTINHGAADYLRLAALLRAEVQDLFPKKRDWIVGSLERLYPKVNKAEIEATVDLFLAKPIKKKPIKDVQRVST